LAARTPPGNTPEVQRQYLGCVGKIANGIVTVLLEGTRGTFQTLLYLPNSWSEDRDQWRAGPEVHQVMSPEPPADRLPAGPEPALLPEEHRHGLARLPAADELELRRRALGH